MKKLLLSLLLFAACATEDPADPNLGTFHGTLTYSRADVLVATTPGDVRITSSVTGNYLLVLIPGGTCASEFEMAFDALDPYGGYPVVTPVKTCLTADSTDTVTLFGFLTEDRRGLELQLYLENPIDGMREIAFTGSR